LKGRGKLKETIQEINQSQWRNKLFCEGGIYYLPRFWENNDQKLGIEIVVIGDTHGDSEATFSIIKQVKFIENQNKGEKNQILIFLGDYIDRGRASLHNLEIVLNLKLNYPQNVILLRGNHEEGGGFIPYELPYDLAEVFGGIGGEISHEKLVELFELLGNLVVTSNGLVMVHGGIPSREIRGLKELINNEELFHQMRWNDPEEEVKEREFGNRGSFDFCLFGKLPFKRFMEVIGGKIMIRSHEYFSEGFKKYFNGELITIFSTGEGSKESGYFNRVKPKFLRIDLKEEITKIKDEWIKEVF